MEKDDGLRKGCGKINLVRAWSILIKGLEGLNDKGTKGYSGEYLPT